MKAAKQKSKKSTSAAKPKSAAKKVVKRKIAGGKAAKKRAAKARPKKSAKKAAPPKAPAKQAQPRANKSAPRVQEVAFRADLALSRGSNRALLFRLLRARPTDDRALDPPYDGVARGLLAGDIQNAGVPVSSAAIIACEIVGCVLREMGRVNPAGRD